MIKLPEIQYITRNHSELSHAEQAELMFANGISWVQIRMKDATLQEVEQESIKALESAKKHKGVLIINDNVQLAKKIGAHGVHIGLNDCPANEAHQILGDDFIIGGTANTIDDVIKQVALGVDYVGLGPFRFTQTKKNLSPVLGISGYHEIVRELCEAKINIPIVGVGGITMSDIAEIKATGLSGVAMSKDLLEEVLKRR